MQKNMSETESEFFLFLNFYVFNHIRSNIREVVIFNFLHLFLNKPNINLIFIVFVYLMRVSLIFLFFEIILWVVPYSLLFIGTNFLLSVILTYLHFSPVWKQPSFKMLSFMVSELPFA